MEIKKFTIVFTGLGGQGLITILKILGNALMNKGYHVVSSETHGLAQRGGKVSCFLRFGNSPISPLPIIGSAEIIVATEKSCFLDVLLYAKQDNSTKIIISTFEKHVIGEKYPSEEYIDKSLRGKSDDISFIPVNGIAQKRIIKSRSANIILLGYLSRFLPLNNEDLKNSVRTFFHEEFLEINLKALKAGLEFK